MRGGKGGMSVCIAENYASILHLLDLRDGVMIWKEREGSLAFNVRYAGKPVTGKINPEGYRVFSIHQREFRFHVALWMLAHGAPRDEIDHINGNRSDNRLENLRVVSASVNRRNMALRSDNRSGVAGVSFSRGKWVAVICVGGQRHAIGSFATFEDAARARLQAQEQFGFTARHGLAA